MIPPHPTASTESTAASEAIEIRSASPSLVDELADSVRRLVRLGPDSADSPSLSEQALLNLGSDRVEHLIAGGTTDAEILVYAQLGTEPADDDQLAVTAEIVTVPQRAPEVATALLEQVLARAAGRPVLVWAHGSASPINAVAAAVGLRPARTLFQLRLDLAGYAPSDGEVGEPELPELPELPEGIVIRAFRPGIDDAQWLAVNSRSFAHHPEQGGWTQVDLQARLDADWFDPAGFLVAMRGETMLGETMLGYHWTKVHPATASSPALGEVYVLGVDPAAQGLKLGSTLLVRGLRHLAAAGLQTALLYVDESNSAAVSLYRKVGFSTFATDVQYRAN
ncbi:mycothiol synthase [soil metagenome]